MDAEAKQNNISAGTVVKRSDDQEFSSIDGEVIMLSLKKGEYYALNSVASDIWNLLDKPVSVEDLIRKLMGEYDVEYEPCRQDTLRCLDDFLEKAIIQIIRD